ncbi:MAG: ribokinase [Proteobacteria bacterium]|nr:ribokinase [Pseudomonadota bacterium]
MSDDSMDWMQDAPRIVVLGSLNMDLVLRVPHAPDAGETLMGRSIARSAGGKGGNQAVSCARQGAAVQMMGCIGADADGRALREALEQDGIDTRAVRVQSDEPTGTALVMVDDAGQNRIVVIAGANAQARASEAELTAALTGAAFLLIQFETPMAEAVRAMQVARQVGCRVLMNPSPVHAVDDALWPLVDTLVVNEVEAAELSGLPVRQPLQAAAAARVFHDRGVPRIVVTLGHAGAVALDADGARHHPAPRMDVVDTTAAGDTLTGALAAELARGATLDQALGQGIRAAALCVMQLGAQSSIPSRDAVLHSAPAPIWTRLPS